MNLGFKRSGADFLTFVPFHSSISTLTATEYDTGAGSSFYGNTIDLQTYSGYETAILAYAIRDYTISSNVSSSQELVVTAHWVTDTSSAFGGSTTLGSTFTMSIKPTSAQSSEEGVFVCPVNLNDAGCYRYVRALLTIERASGDGDGPDSPRGMYILMGRDQNPTSSHHNVQYGGAPSTA